MLIDQHRPGVMVCCFLVLACALSYPSAAPADSSCSMVDLDWTLEPGVWHGFFVSTPAAVDRGYVVDVTPLEPASDGDHVELVRSTLR